MSDYSEHLISMAGGDGEADLDAIESRAQAATTGPWEVTKEATIIAPIPNSGDAYWLFEAHAAHKDGRGIPVDDCIADAEFIAHARTDIPALLAMVREQRAAIERVEKLADKLEAIQGYRRAATHLRAALEKS
ncbi:hypothetical protein [Arthrobacter sp. ES3-54]|uniref:hypothetical protein n=1 Tax=Arthrobacter sp. ES3-54 TaxID=1502991 RepID=UPI00240508B5|nr:hypothetical protein [Arthrobacter sp. ES3-54]MDF9748657.1 hypothetical protein [Arthrobacter sp. ES3-54]